MKLNFKKNKSGVSLIELVVAVTLFSILILSATSIFKMVIDGQRNAISAQNIQENMRYVLERISKEIRMAQVSNTTCEPTAIYKVFNTTGAGQVLHFKNKDDKCVTYYLENNRLKTTVESGASLADDYITPSRISISNLKFYIEDDLISAFHSKQPYVTVVMDVKVNGLAVHEQRMKIQFTVSSRYYE